MTPFWTLFINVVIFVITQYFLKMVIEPVAKVRRLMAEVSIPFLMYRATLLGGRQDDETRKELARVAAHLMAGTGEVFGYKVWRHLFGLPSQDEIAKACREINGQTQPFPDGITPEQARMRENSLDEIARILKIRTIW